MTRASFWGAGADDWSGIQEPRMRPLFDAMLDALRVAPPAKLLDVGCGTGLLCSIAAKRGFDVIGLDQSEGFLETAGRRASNVQFMHGDSQALPFEDGSFDAVLASNSIQFAQQPQRAISEIKRVLRPGGTSVIGVWAPPERSDASIHMRAVASLIPAESRASGGPFALSAADQLTDLLRTAGFAVAEEREVAIRWEYPDEETLLRGVTSAGSTHLARATAGDERVFEVLRAKLKQFRQHDGSYILNNLFIVVVSEKPR